MSKVRRDFFAKKRGQRVTQLMARDGTNCTICGEALDRKIQDPESPRFITFDHKVPISHGGTSMTGNLRLAHRECNMRRGNQPLTEEKVFRSAPMVVRRSTNGEELWIEE